MSQYRNPVIHHKGPNVFVGDYELNDAALKRYGVAREQFGNTRVIVPDNRQYFVKDFPYRVAGDAVGMRIVPVSDTKVLRTADGRIVPGFQLLDEHLRFAMQLSESDPIFAYLSYFHPEHSSGTLDELAAVEKTQAGFTHTGTYLGEGLTSNSPVNYHRHRFEVDGHSNGLDGYPAHVYFISLEKVPQSVLNANAHLADGILNHGVNFPLNYLQAQFRVLDLNTAFMFYRDWITCEKYLRIEQNWFSYCMAHKSIVTNIMLNLPHNEASFREVYGDEGEDIFKAFKFQYGNVHGFEFTQSDETHFEPLWKKEGLRPEEVRPLPLSKYHNHEKARNAGTLATFDDVRPLGPTRGTAWGPFYSADLVLNFVATYASMLDAGAVASAAVVLRFMSTIDARMGIAEKEYLGFAMPVVQEMMLADARTNARRHPGAYVANTYVALYKAIGGEGDPAHELEDILLQKRRDPGIDQLHQRITTQPKHVAAAVIAGWALAKVVENWDTIIESPPWSTEAAYEDFCERIKAAVERARHLPTAAPGKIQCNMLPAVLHLASIGAIPHNKHIRVNTVCTIVQEKDVQIKPTPVTCLHRS